MPSVRGRGAVPRLGRAGPRLDLRGDEYGDVASVSMSSGMPERHAERSPPLPPRCAPRRPCSVKRSVPILDADEAITNRVSARLQTAAHNSAPRSTSEVASVPDEGGNQRFIIEVISCNQM